MFSEPDVRRMLDESIDAAEAREIAPWIRIGEVGSTNITIDVKGEPDEPDRFAVDAVLSLTMSNDQAMSVIRETVDCRMRSRRRRQAIASWNERNDRDLIAPAEWAIAIHEMTRSVLKAQGVDPLEALTRTGRYTSGEVADFRNVSLSGDTGAYVFDEGNGAVRICVPSQEFPDTVLMALAGMPIDAAITHPELPRSATIRSARCLGTTLILVVNPEYRTLSPAPPDADMAWKRIGVSPWQRTTSLMR